MEYRIIKKYYRRNRDARVIGFYQVQYLGKSFSLFHFPFKKIWKPCKIKHYYGIDVSLEDADFDNIKDAQQYWVNIQMPKYADELVVPKGMEL